MLVVYSVNLFCRVASQSVALGYANQSEKAAMTCRSSVLPVLPLFTLGHLPADENDRCIAWKSAAEVIYISKDKNYLRFSILLFFVCCHAIAPPIMR